MPPTFKKGKHNDLTSFLKIQPHLEVLFIEFFFADIKNMVNNDMWNSMIIQHKSDMIRSLLLLKFGGIWIDSSVMCVQPLSEWLDYSKPFVTFVRNDQFMDQNTNGKPVIGKNMP